MKTIKAKLVQGAAWLPIPAMLIGALVGWQSAGDARSTPDAAQFVGSEACVKCHASIARSFLKSPHVRTLTSMPETRLAARLGGEEVADPGRQSALAFDMRQGAFSVRSPQFGRPIPLQWCFGSGQHAQTMVGVLEGVDGQPQLLQCRLSWYAKTDGLDLTPGESSNPPSRGIEWLGRLSDEAQLRRCFGCHSTYWQESDGRIDFQSLVAGIQCEKCHGPRAEHARNPRISSTAVPGIASRSAIESVRWCGVCHRQDELVGPADLDPSNLQLVRFAPIGLVQSKCFRQSPPDQQPTCLVCHDPHGATSRDSIGYSDECRRCHSSRAGENAVVCASSPKASNCLPCHMPKVSVGPTTFTDHWIRIRGE